MATNLKAREVLKRLEPERQKLSELRAQVAEQEEVIRKLEQEYWAAGIEDRNWK